MDDKTKKLLEAIKAMKNEIEELAYKNREATDNSEDGSYWQGYYEGKADGLEDAALKISNAVSEWASSLYR